MNTHLIDIGLGILAAPAALLLGASGFVAQDAGGRLTRVEEQSSRQEVDPWDRESWRGKLGASDLDQRERAFELLLDAARRSEDARSKLELWSKDESDSEFAWTARLALRELDRFGRGAAGPGQFWFQFPHSNLGRGFDLTPFFDYEPSPDSNGTVWQWIDPGATGGAPQVSKSQVQLSITPEGVEAKITREVDGVEETEEYSAESMDALLEAHPELRGDLGGGLHRPLGSSFGTGLDALGNFGFGMGFPGGFRFDSSGPRALDLFGRRRVRTDILGVYVRPVADAGELANGELPDSGLWIEAVVAGTIAAELNLERGQTLVELNGRALSSRDDISSELRSRPPEDEIDVVVIEVSGERKTLTWKPEAKPLPEGAGAEGQRKL